ncbi:MAG: hypothetical protein OEY50_06475 [Nitrospinota bacterium]|nr:hypothetical protein [Nitrospinota bacterium]MDH5679098.1 hypothetical protein [Nitrospinota bacterium]MDH5756597.1 hypothetical protein [Nitrospinota bacterium]
MKPIGGVANRVALLLVFAYMTAASGPAMAACPADAVFKTFNRMNEATRPIGQDLSFSQGKVEAAKGFGRDIHARVPSLPLIGDFNPRVTRPLNGHVWELSLPFGSNIQAENLLITYLVSGGTGRTGFFQSRDNPASIIQATVIPRRIEKTIFDDRIVFRGYIDVDLDFQDATVAGGYTGMISAAVECQ